MPKWKCTEWDAIGLALPVLGDPRACDILQSGVSPLPTPGAEWVPVNVYRVSNWRRGLWLIKQKEVKSKHC